MFLVWRSISSKATSKLNLAAASRAVAAGLCKHLAASCTAIYLSIVSLKYSSASSSSRSGLEGRYGHSRKTLRHCCRPSNGRFSEMLHNRNPAHPRQDLVLSVWQEHVAKSALFMVGTKESNLVDDRIWGLRFLGCLGALTDELRGFAFDMIENCWVNVAFDGMGHF